MSERSFADRLKIEVGRSGRETRVLLDGKMLHGVRAVWWSMSLDGPSHVTLEAVGLPEIVNADVEP